MSRRCTPIDGGTEVNPDNDDMDNDSQYTDLSDENCEYQSSVKSWSYLLNEDDGVDFRSKVPIWERIKIADEKEKELTRIARTRRMASIPDDYVPVVRVKPPEETEEEKAAKYKAWREKIERMEREKEEMRVATMKWRAAEREKFLKLEKEYRTRDYYWKPDPLFALHMKILGYSKIAIDKALYYTDNRSVAKAVEYLKNNPNPTELTKEEVMAPGEEILQKYRNINPAMYDHTDQTLPKESEMEIEQASQSLLCDDDNPTCVVSNDEAEEDTEGPKEIPKVDPVKDPTGNDEMIEDNIRRGTKRNYAGQEVTFFPTTSKCIGLPLSPVKEEIPLEYKMFFLVNVQLLMDAVTLSLEVGKVVANLTDKMRAGTDDLKKMFDEWIKQGNQMSMYKGNNSDHLTRMYEATERVGVLSYLGTCSHYRHIKTPSNTVIGIIGDTEKLELLQNRLELL